MKKKLTIGISLVAILIIGYFVLDSILFDGIRPRYINEGGFQGNYFANEATQNQPTIILIGGGIWGGYWGSQFARDGYVGLSLPYSGKDGLPDLPEEIPLEYFEDALKWLRKQAEVNPEKIILMGASRNAELALVIAATFPQYVHGVIAYAPSAVSWSNTVLPYNSDRIMASWTYNGKDIPFIPMEKFKAGDSPMLNTLAYWESGLQKADTFPDAFIPLENLQGPILLFSGKDDKVWPSASMADMIEARLKEKQFGFSFENIQYENAGHLISNDPDRDSDVRIGSMRIGEKDYEFEFGGTLEGDRYAKQDARQRVKAFLERLRE